MLHSLTLLSSSRFSVRPVPSPDDAAPLIELDIQGTATGKIVAGAVLEAAIQWNDLYLAFVTDDIPQEETLRIYLLDQTGNTIDTATLGAMYSTGAFSQLELVQPDTVRFRFIGNTVWTLELLPEPIARLPFISDPKGVSRPFRLTTRFKLSGAPRPDPKKASAPIGC